MSARDDLKRAMAGLKQTLAEAARQARARSARGDQTTRHVNVARRSNIVVTGAVGGRDAVRAASVRQTSHIRQRDGQTIEESEVTTRTTEGGSATDDTR